MPASLKKRCEIIKIAAIAITAHIAIASIADCALAQSQIVPDNTLGNESSLVIPNAQGLLLEVIDGGAIRGTNLFHSFREFNVSEGKGAYFIKPTGVENILSRVTGDKVSQILGTLGVLGNANLFLMNPNGIIFGQNASLDVQGSFVATTANAIQFGDRGFFSATNPQSPSSLLTINPSAFLFNQIQTAQIKNQSIAPLENGLFGLQVPNGQSLLLVGGEIIIDKGVLNALGGRIELAAVGGTGTAELNFDGNQLSLSFPKDLALTDVSIINGSLLRVDASDGGNIAIDARSLEILGESFLVAGIGFELGSPGSQAGNITLNSLENIKLEQSSRIINNVFPNAIGNGGDIRITTRSLFVLDGAQLRTITFGQGNTGSVIIDAGDTVSFNGSLTGAISFVSETAQGQGGDIRINTGSLSLSNGAQLQAATSGWGNAGSVVIDARDNIAFDGGDNSGFVSGIFNDVNETGRGRGGDIRIRTGSLSLTNGAELSSSTYGKGDAGNITIDARDIVSLSGLRIINENKLSSGIFSNVQRDAEGNGGKIQIATGSLFISKSAELDVGTFGRGNGGSVTIDARDTVSFDEGNIFSNVVEGAIGQGGDIRINANSISLTNSAEIQTSTEGQGNAGNVFLTARNTISFDGVSTSPFENGLFPSGIFSEVEETGKGNGGDIRLSSDSVALTNGAQLVASTSGQGDAGQIAIEARGLIFIDGIGINKLPSGVFTRVAKTGEGKGGDIRFNSDSVSLTNGARLDALTLGQENAGNLMIDSRNKVFISGVGINGISSGLFTNTENGANGQGGAITVQTNSFRIEDGAVVNAQTSNAYQGGNVSINANTFEATDGGQIITTARSSGQAGNITINADDSAILSGGDLKFSRRLDQFGEDIVTNQGAASGLFANTTSSSTGKGGNISINARRLTVRDSAKVVVDSQGTGVGGNVDINTDFLTLSDRASISAETASNTGGNIDLQVGDLLLLRNGSNISTTAGIARASGDGGNIDIDANFIFAVPNEDSNITANAFEGKGGNIEIATEGIFGIQFREQETLLSDITASSQFGTQGQVTIAEPNVDFNKTIVQLPSLIDPSGQIAKGCPSQGRISEAQLGSFTITGRGGLPPSPVDPRSSDAVLTDWATIETEGESEATNVETQILTERIAKPIIEAQGWVRSSKGEIVLFAQIPYLTPSSLTIPNNCSGLRNFL